MVVPLETGWHHLPFEGWSVDPEVADPRLPESLGADSVYYYGPGGGRRHPSKRTTLRRGTR